MPTLALCIPAYNAAKFLPNLLLSAAKQTIPFDEILVYNDQSSDDTSAIAREWGAQVLDGSLNVGCSTGKNRLAEIAKSDFLHFHDADDVLLPNFTEVAHKWLNKEVIPDIILLHYQYKNFETGEMMGEPTYNVEELKADPIKFSIEQKIVNFALIKKSVFLNIGGFDTDPNVLYNEDRAFYTKAAISGLTFDFETETTCINYYFPGSMSANNISKCAAAAVHVWRKVVQRTGSRYNEEIAIQLLQNATYAASGLDWDSTTNSIKLSRRLFSKASPEGSAAFKILYSMFPLQAFYIREKLIRSLTKKRKKK